MLDGNGSHWGSVLDDPTMPCCRNRFLKIWFLDFQSSTWAEQTTKVNTLIMTSWSTCNSWFMTMCGRNDCHVHVTKLSLYFLLAFNLKFSKTWQDVLIDNIKRFNLIRVRRDLKKYRKLRKKNPHTYESYKRLRLIRKIKVFMVLCLYLLKQPGFWPQMDLDVILDWWENNVRKPL